MPPRRLGLAIEAGLSDFGENQVQEAEAKAGAGDLGGGARWHLVGHLQSNKAGRAVSLFSSIHSVDSIDLARRLDRLQAARQEGPGAARPLPVYLQLNVDDDPAKAGFTASTLEAALPELAGLGMLDLRGLMTIGRLVERPEQARPSFARLRRLSERLRATEPRLGPGLSMGMSDDFETAVEEGSTVVRIGRLIFGPRLGH